VTRVLCGIPAVTLEGTPDDWRTIARRLEGFAEMGLGWWFGPLRPVLERIALSAVGEVDRAFWNSMYRSSDSNGRCAPGASASGWISLFFPYLIDRDGAPTRRNPWMAEPRAYGESPSSRDSLFPTDEDPDHATPRLPIGELPTGLAMANMTEVERDLDGRLRRTRPMEFIAGFVGVAQDPETLCLRPEIGWAVRERAG
jgi:hypothetical protein